jgi:hypothetical protein
MKPAPELDLSLVPFVKYDPDTGDVLENGLMPKHSVDELVRLEKPYLHAAGKFGQDSVDLKAHPPKIKEAKKRAGHKGK